MRSQRAEQGMRTIKNGSILKLKRKGQEANLEYGKVVDIKIEYLIFFHCVSVVLVAQPICSN